MSEPDPDIPSPEEEEAPVYTRKKRKKRGRPPKRGRPKKRIYTGDLSPSKRENRRWKTVILPEDYFFRLQEMALFYKKSLSKMTQQLIDAAFEKAYQESLTLQRIDATRKKKDEVQDPDNAARRTHF